MSDDLQVKFTTIHNVESATTRNGKPYMKVTDSDGDLYSCWKEDWNERLEAGEFDEREVTLVFKENNGYYNIDAIMEGDKREEYEKESDLDHTAQPEKKSKPVTRSKSGGMDDYVTWEDTLAKAFDRYEELDIETEVLFCPLTHETDAWVVRATVTCPVGVFTGIGDASPENVQGDIEKALPRMAETRAMSRAVKHALGIGKTGKEEIPGAE